MKGKRESREAGGEIYEMDTGVDGRRVFSEGRIEKRETEGKSKKAWKFERKVEKRKKRTCSQESVWRKGKKR